MSEEGTAVSGAPAEVATSLSRGTNWWGAFVIGLAGTILVTGIVPFAVSSMGAAAIPAIALVVVIGLIVCLGMGELAALLPHRTGGMPSYAYESFEPLGQTTAKHIGGVSSWGYWLGWFPVAPINMLLAAGYIAVLFHVPLGPTFCRSGTSAPLSPSGCWSSPWWVSWLVRPLLLRHPAGRHVRHHPGSDVHGPPDAARASSRSSSPPPSTGPTSRASTTPTRPPPGPSSSWAGSS